METHWAKRAEWKLNGLNLLSGVSKKIQRPRLLNPNPLWKLIGLNSLNGVNQKVKGQGY